MARTMLQQELYEQYIDQGIDPAIANQMALDVTEDDPHGFGNVDG